MCEWHQTLSKSIIHRLTQLAHIYRTQKLAQTNKW